MKKKKNSNLKIKIIIIPLINQLLKSITTKTIWEIICSLIKPHINKKKKKFNKKITIPFTNQQLMTKNISIKTIC